MKRENQSGTLHMCIESGAKLMFLRQGASKGHNPTQAREPTETCFCTQKRVQRGDGDGMGAAFGSWYNVKGMLVCPFQSKKLLWLQIKFFKKVITFIPPEANEQIQKVYGLLRLLVKIIIIP